MKDKRISIENEIYKKSCVDFTKLEDYGFIKNKDNYILEKEFLNNNFKAVIIINSDGTIVGKVIDLDINEEYLNIRTDMNGEFVNKVRESYKEILNDIKEKCFISKNFIFDQTNRINNYIKNKYNNSFEFLWDKFPGYAVYRNNKNKKWYSIIMNIDISKIDKGNGEIEIINVKVDNKNTMELLKKEGYYESYHMSKKDWISIILNETVTDDEIFKLIDESYNIINNS